MNNTVAKYFFAAIGFLLVVSVIFNSWINKELVQTVKPNIVIQLENATSQQNSPVVYDPSSDYPSYPSGIRDEVIPIVVKKPQRILDKKIIYEMPTSNRILIQ